MDIIMVPLLLLLKAILGLAVVIVVADVIVSWLIVANILNTGSNLVCSIVRSLSITSEYMLRPIRDKIPLNIGPMDFSPLALILLLTFVERIIDRILIRFI
jgi:uncharacterized protein YggT (Ycf19 family)